MHDEQFTCPAGSFVFIPAGMPHGFRVGTEPSRKRNLYVPAAMVGYFDELSAALADGAVDPALLAEIADRYRMEVTALSPRAMCSPMPSCWPFEGLCMTDSGL